MPPRTALLSLITLARIPLAVAFALLILLADSSVPVVAVGLALLIVAELTDLLDGLLARRWGLTSEWGAMLDPFSDSVSRLLIYYALAGAKMMLPVVPLVMALRDVTVAYCRIVLTKRGKSVSANLSGKIKAIVQCSAAMLAVLGPIHWKYTGQWTVTALSWIVLMVTAASVVQYGRAAVAATAHATEQEPKGNA